MNNTVSNMTDQLIQAAVDYERAEHGIDVRHTRKELHAARAAIEDAFAEMLAPVGVKALEWRKPTDHPKDPDEDDSLFCADGIGGVYSVSVRQSVGPAYLLWWAHDPMEWTGFDSVEAAKAAAQADFASRLRASLEERT